MASIRLYAMAVGSSCCSTAFRPAWSSTGREQLAAPAQVLAHRAVARRR